MEHEELIPILVDEPVDPYRDRIIEALEYPERSLEIARQIMTELSTGTN